ncbi:methyltransferase domain-containing protein [Streptomyces sp. NY05-11A]|uniref:methyltransferase domain-containing protein n=1 Tax=Streptomyces soliscabiei TaxID=588897 RepID=UPI0029AD07ED|nr:methyltransferase domain-containing protein [Streptomyces sp. NY05-11A]MDX2678862.1 methyltransferase domain-containing protein [Streptomyces sp. NY05-11A]
MKKASSVLDDGMSLEGSAAELHRAVVHHFDQLVDLYEELWGEHIHHGYWDLDRPDVHRYEAQLRTVRELIAYGSIPGGGRVLDSGCGIGASAQVLVRDLGCRVDGITISAEQVRRAREKAVQSGLAERIEFRLTDAMKTDYAEGTFDAVWSLESCELMPDKRAYLAECLRVLKPGGTLVVATWCSRDGHLDPAEVRLLRRMYRGLTIPYVLPLAQYRDICEDLGFCEVDTADWTDNVRATWKLSTEILKPITRNPWLMLRLLRAKGLEVLRTSTSVPLMKRLYGEGIMRYGVFRATKPEV